MVVNAAEEFIEHVKGRTITCAHVQSEHYADLKLPRVVLKECHTEEDYQRFLAHLGFDYDAGYGAQELTGTIWFSDGSWSTRGEYDGSEWWEHHKCPPVPADLK
jgi:hypothetical protein